MTFVALLVVLAAGCVRPTGQTTLPSSDQAELALITVAAEESWRGQGELGEPGRCLADTRVVWASSSSWFAFYCGSYVAVGDHAGAAGCLTTDIGGRAAPLVVLAPGQPLTDTTGGVVLHEYDHALAQCRLGSPDNGHTDPRVWSAAAGKRRELGTPTPPSAQELGRERVLKPP